MTSDLFREEAHRRFRAEPWQPPLLSKAPSGVLMGLLAVLAAAALVAFATTFRFAQKEQVQGYLTPTEGWSQVSARDFAVAARVVAMPGDAVRAGDVLLELSSGEGLGRGRTVAHQLLDEMAKRKLRIEARMALIESQIEVEQTLHAQEQAASRRELEGLEREIAWRRDRLLTAEERLRNGRGLQASGLLSKADVMALEDELAARSLGVSEKEREADRARTRLASADAQLQKLLIEAERDHAALAGQIHALAMEESRIRGQAAARILAPRDGFVAAVRVRPGDQLRPGDALLDIVPEDSALTARLFARSSAMGQVEPGQTVKVYLDAFPYQRHGAQTGRILAIFETMVQAGESRTANSPGIPPGEPLFRIDVEFPDGFRLTPRQRASLRPGMTLTADLVTSRGTLADWILRPLSGAAQRL